MNLRSLAEAFAPAWAKPRPAKGPATHDYTLRLPGHDVAVTTVRAGGQRIHVMGWGNGIVVGDFVILPNQGATTRYRVDSIRYYSDPADMFSADLAFAPRGA